MENYDKSLYNLHNNFAYIYKNSFINFNFEYITLYKMI